MSRVSVGILHNAGGRKEKEKGKGREGGIEGVQHVEERDQLDKEEFWINKNTWEHHPTHLQMFMTFQFMEHFTTHSISCRTIQVHGQPGITKNYLSFLCLFIFLLFLFVKGDQFLRNCCLFMDNSLHHLEEEPNGCSYFKFGEDSS